MKNSFSQYKNCIFTGKWINRDVYVWRLKKSGAVKSKFDDCKRRKDHKIEGLICGHVDDFFVGVTKNFEENWSMYQKRLLRQVRKNLKIWFTYSTKTRLYILTQQKQDCILDQQMYIYELKEVNNCKERKMSNEAPLNTEVARQIRGQAGQLIWKSTSTRPDLSFGACEVTVSGNRELVYS